jgi:hypothetical protein
MRRNFVARWEREMRRKSGPAEIVLEPDLSHCIETTAREEFERGVRLLLEGESQPGLTERTELLRLFLETADFGELRRISEPLLAQGLRVTFTVYEDGGEARCRLQAS